ncbi:MAG: NTP transferase domain-containing protein [Flammeovirgaceae bacterium]|nr:NTP transferase domain-containing protein [Flammeovirgaceae bacterium]
MNSNKIPILNGLVLVGGKSSRMGQDKGLLNYHGIPQREFTYHLIEKFCETTWFSCREDQVVSLSGFNSIVDQVPNSGSFGAIFSAFRQNSNCAWLVVACDLPLLDEETIQMLIDKRNPEKIATAYNSPIDHKPEPLIAIWEPSVMAFLEKGKNQIKTGPRKILMMNDANLINSENPDALKNANYPEDFREIKSRLK